VKTKPSLLFLLLLITGIPCLSFSAQTQSPSIVEKIQIEFKGKQTVSKQAIMAHIQTREGMKLNQYHIDRSIRSLYTTKLFENIEVKVTESPADAQVKLTFILHPKYPISEIHFTGNKKIKNRHLIDLIESKPNNLLDELTLKKDRRNIIQYYQKKGYLNTQVEYITAPDHNNTGTTVTFNINEDKKIKIKDIQFQGNENIPSKKLLKQMKTKKYNPLLSWITHTGRFNQKILDDDLETLRNYYKNQGYLDIQLLKENIKLQYPCPSRLTINLSLNEGPIYQTGTTTFQGNTLFTEQELKTNLSLKSTQPLSPWKLRQDQLSIMDLYGEKGYLDTRVSAKRKLELQTQTIHLHYTIEEKEKTYVQSINIAGNSKTKNIVILRELNLAPGDVFDPIKMRNSQARLKNTHYFEQVQLTPQDTQLPGRKTLDIKVKEAPTGTFSFGAGFSSLERALFFAELTQGNFDLFNPNSYFQGDGQKFRLRLQISSASNEAILSFEEPWFMEQRLALGTELFRTESDYVSSLYNELRTGLEVYLRKQLIGLWEGRFSYRLEDVKIFDVSEEAPVIVKDEKEHVTVSKVEFSLLHDTRDSFLFTTEGNRLNLITEFAGLGGDCKYIKLEARASQFYPLWNDPEKRHVLSLIGRVGTLIDLENEGIPFFERYYLGGPNSLRGFDFREVGPKDTPTKEPIGGNSFGFFSIEYSYLIAKQIQLALFYDAGFLNKEEIDFNINDYNDNWGFGIRLLILGAPLRLDYGIPIKSDHENDNGNQFYFSFGTRF
jgi:outer membrane protein insertion porin family